MENLHDNKKLRAALQKWLTDRRSDAAYWEGRGEEDYPRVEAEYLAACEREGCDPNDHENGVYEQYFVSEDTAAAYQEQEARADADDVAAIVISHLQRGSRPWATIHRADIADSVIGLFGNREYPTESRLIEAISAGLDARTKTGQVYIEFQTPSPLFSGDEEPAEGLRRLAHLDWSESRLGVTFLLQGNDAEVIVEGRITERARFAFERSIRDIVGQCTAVAGAADVHAARGEAEVRTDPPSLVSVLFGADPMAPILELDGPLSIVTVSPDEPAHFDLGTVPIRTEGDLARLRYLLSQVFITAGNLTGPTRYEAGLRYAVWNLASISVLGASPLAFIGCMAVAERCLSDLLSREREPLGFFLRSELRLEPEVSGNLDRLIQIRNDVIHDLTCPVSSADFWKARRLATTAAHFLLAKLAGAKPADAHNRPITLADAVRSILRESESVLG